MQHHVQEEPPAYTLPRQMNLPQSQSDFNIRMPQSFHESQHHTKLQYYPSQRQFAASTHAKSPLQMNSQFAQQYEASTQSYVKSVGPRFESKTASYGNSGAQLHEGHSQQFYEPVRYIQVNYPLVSETSKKSAQSRGMSAGSAEGTPVNKYESNRYASGDGIQVYA